MGKKFEIKHGDNWRYGGDIEYRPPCDPLDETEVHNKTNINYIKNLEGLAPSVQNRPMRSLQANIAHLYAILTIMTHGSMKYK